MRDAFIFAPGLYGGMFFFQLVLTLLAFVQVGSIGLIVDSLISISQGSAEVSILWKYVIIYIMAKAIPILFETLYSTCDTIFFRKFSDHNKILFIQKTAQFDIQVLEDGGFQNTKSKALEQGEYAMYIVAEYGMLLIINTVSIITAIFYLAYFNWLYALLAFVAAFPAFLVEFIHGKRVYGLWDEDTVERRICEDRMSLLTKHSTKSSLVEIRLFSNIKFFIAKVSDFLYSFQVKTVDSEKKRARDDLLGNGVYITAYSGALYLVVVDVLSKIISIGQFSVALGSFEILSSQLAKMFGNFAKISRYSRYSKDWFNVMDTPNVLQKPENPTEFIRCAPTIEFRDVWFRYPGSDAWVFKGLNLTLESGSRVALVGHNGAGKTTFVQLLLRIYDPTRGSVFVNGVDLREIDLDQYYRNTAALMQEFATFKFPVREAIALGDTSVPIDEERVVNAAYASHAYSFIESWDEGYDAMIGREFDGKELSGGERQRMAIARVFYRNAGLVILDEPTSAVDAIAEQEIFESVYTSGNTQTILTISHRFSTVKKSDIIVVLEHGEVQEQGPHADLIAQKGRYYDLYSAQASAYND